jgi:hypothetical protein
MEPRVFIASSGEANDLAVALQSALERFAAVEVWSQGVFEQNKSNLENLLQAANDFDFACVFATADDFLVSKEKAFQAPRDNILFEFGLFLGALGRDRVFLLHPRDLNLKLPTDLGGVAFLDFKLVDSENTAKSVLGPPALVISNQVRSLGPRASSRVRRYSRVLERGGMDQISALADAALYFPRRRFGYRQKIIEHVLKKELIPTFYYYLTEEGAEFWIKMSSDPRYKFQNNSLALVRTFSQTFAQNISAPFDFISLGSGDGEKDRILLEAVIKRTEESIFYYPIDISDKLLVECVRNVFKGSLASSNIRTRAILGDFCDLDVLRAVYEDRPIHNVFSILGNSLGNTDEAKILNALKDAMYPGDYLLLEVNCSIEEISKGTAFLRSDFVREYCSLPLSIIGIDVDVAKVDVRKVDGLSVFKAAKSVETTYQEAVLEGRRLTNIPLEHDHRYDFKMLLNELVEQLGVDVVASQTRGSAGIVLARKSGANLVEVGGPSRMSARSGKLPRSAPGRLPSPRTVSRISALGPKAVMRMATVSAYQPSVSEKSCPSDRTP